MTVAQLIEVLKTMPQDAVVVANTGVNTSYESKQLDVYEYEDEVHIDG
jgi:hypothetical protein